MLISNLYQLISDFELALYYEIQRFVQEEAYQIAVLFLTWVWEDVALIRGRRLFETRHLLEEIWYVALNGYYWKWLWVVAGVEQK